jgi:hypothetical protein
MRAWLAAAYLVASLAAAPVSSAERPSLDAMAWMEGRWTGVTGELHMEEHWTSPAGNALIGMHKDVKAGKMVMFEFLRIEAREDGVYYVASPYGRPPTPFKLIEHADRRLVFENAENDFPQRILYWSTAPGELWARIEGTVGGKEKSMEWRWERAKP